MSKAAPCQPSALALAASWARIPGPHHERYARAWYLYNDPNLSNKAKETLEREMDSVQNDFSWSEFQSFKATLPGYVAHWKALGARAHAVLPNAADVGRADEAGPASAKPTSNH